MKAGLIVAVLVLAACNPQDVVDKAVARTAEAVISPVVGPAATRCIVDNASPEDLRAIAVDVGVEAGTTTLANIARIAGRPETMACLAAGGLAQVAL